MLHRVDMPIAQRPFVMRMSDGEEVLANERFYVVAAAHRDIVRDGWTALETDIIAEHRWWTREELAQTSDTVWPADLPALLSSAGAW